MTHIELNWEGPVSPERAQVFDGIFHLFKARHPDLFRLWKGLDSEAGTAAALFSWRLAGDVFQEGSSVTIEDGVARLAAFVRGAVPQ
jgi:hypothetical protein